MLYQKHTPKPKRKQPNDLAQSSEPCDIVGELIHSHKLMCNLLATAKEQTESTSKDKRNARAGEKPEQVWGYIAINTQTYIHTRAQPEQTQVNIRLSLVSVAEAMSKYAKANL
jgi:hypothetical protein